MSTFRRAAFLLTLAGIFLVAAAMPASAFLFGKEEAAPTGVSGAPIAQSMDIETYQGIAYTGTLSAVDNEGDALLFSILEPPSKGTVTIAEDGITFLYTPAEGKTGKDSFTYTATDPAGNTSVPATVSITITKQKTAVSYADMAGHPAANAAVCLAEEGIYVGRQVNGSYFFDPDETISRSEFLAMAMTVAGLDADSGVSLTGFADDSSIAAWAKGYATAAVREGVISGVATSDGVQFQGEEAISLQEAAAVLNRLLQITDVSVDAGAWDVPSWAMQAAANLVSVQVVSAGSFGAGTAQQPITRAQAAEMLAAALPLAQPEPEGLFGWF